MKVDRYAVVGHPVAHSRSPEIHAAFARETGIAIDYRRIAAPLDGFRDAVDAFFRDGGRGVNVTVPFKLDAFAACGARISERARRAGAVNFVANGPDGWSGDNTDGDGLVRDLERLSATTGRRLHGARVLLVGAGGAARGVLGPLLDAGPDLLVVVNRDVAKASALVEAQARAGRALEARSFGSLTDVPFDLIVNATSASLAGAPLPLHASTLASAALAYDMMYGTEPTAFMNAARDAGVGVVSDGLGMLVEQAAESFFLWRGVRPETAPVLAMLRGPAATRAAR